MQSRFSRAQKKMKNESSATKLGENIDLIEDECENLITEINQHLSLNVAAKIKYLTTTRVQSYFYSRKSNTDDIVEIPQDCVNTLVMTIKKARRSVLQSDVQGRFHKL